ncbi:MULTISPECIES: M20 family peptidase [unclassified Bradyrhizobium]|uniref:M20 family peptidase n=1 Tax=unclassified Bradyrhizobium TaxID=2631580 RepID=UPI001BA8C5D9|nr:MULTISPECIES: M20 family peptidase [unclassified Bradyrhizobium]MBR1223432.1 M20 family peptidase [Bradyrhizobium sp. AUGA SZCCT0176]MBR1298863.1 M20 family peptidase [Bradyrhizobium sp. AUGA SZCCT0042]
MRRLVRIIRNLALLLIAVIVILAGVLAFNVVSHGSRQIQVAAIPRVAVDAQAVAARLSEAIRFRTISSHENPDQHAEALRGMQTHIERSFPAFHAAAKREIVGQYSLLYTWEGSDSKAPPIALLAHQDVVPVAPGTEKDWQQPPFDGVVADGFIWGRGSWDDKGNLYSMLEAAETMTKGGFRPKRTVYFAFGHDEETAGTAGAKAIAALLAARGVRLDFVVDEGLLITEGMIKGLDKSAALIGVAEKGYATLVLNAQATPGHSSMPPRDTAIGMLSAALARLEDHRLPMYIRGTVAEMFDTLAPEMNGFNRVVLSNLWLFKPLLLREFEKNGPSEATIRTTTALTIFNAGDKDNVLPGNAEATVNFRMIPGDTQASVTDHVRSTIRNDRISIKPFPGNTDPPPVTGTASPSFQMFNRTIREVFPDVIVAPGLMVGATDSRHFAGITDKIFRFSPVRANSDDLKRFHGTNERLSLEGYADMIRFYRRLIENAAG